MPWPPVANQIAEHIGSTTRVDLIPSGSLVWLETVVISNNASVSTYSFGAAGTGTPGYFQATMVANSAVSLPIRCFLTQGLSIVSTQVTSGVATAFWANGD